MSGVAGTTTAAPVHVVQMVQGLAIGGLERMALELAGGLQAGGLRASILCFDEFGALTEEARARALSVHLLARRAGIDWSYPFRLARWLRAFEVDVLHLHNPTAFFYGSLAGRLARLPCIVYTEHGRDASRGWKIRLLHRVLAHLVDEIAVVGEHGRRLLAEEEGVSGACITRIYNGIDGERYDSRRYAGRRDAIRASAGLRPGQGPVIGIVARLDPIKNHACLLRAMERVRERFPGAVLVVLGEGPEEASLRRLAAALSLEAHVRFLGSRGDVAELMSVFDVFVLCSVSEGLALTLAEACAAGRPIVATDVGGNAEVVEHGVNGLLVPSDDPEALAGALMRVLGDEHTRAHMGAAGRRKFQQDFDLGAMVERYRALYARCLEASRRTRRRGDAARRGGLQKAEEECARPRAGRAGEGFEGRRG